MDQDVNEKSRTARYAKWEELGVDRVKDDLLNGGLKLVGGSPAVKEMAWDWVRSKEAEEREREKGQNDARKPHWLFGLIEHSVKVVVGFLLVATLAWIGANYDDLRCEFWAYFDPSNTLTYGC